MKLTYAVLISRIYRELSQGNPWGLTPKGVPKEWDEPKVVVDL